MSAWSADATSCTTVATLPNGNGHIFNMSAHTGQSPVQTVPACPVQIRAHHHIDVCTDINKYKLCISQTFSMVWSQCTSIRQKHLNFLQFICA